jgi:hypothetical protein
MENESENFDDLKKLLALKKHEQPPPGYFNKLPGNVVSRIRAEKSREVETSAKLKEEAPWVLRLLRALYSKPVFAGSVGAAACALVLAGVFYAESPGRNPRAVSPFVAPVATAFVPDGTAVAGTGTDLGPTLAGTNLPPSGVNLFDLVQPGINMRDGTAPVSFSPSRTN